MYKPRFCSLLIFSTAISPKHLSFPEITCYHSADTGIMPGEPDLPFSKLSVLTISLGSCLCSPFLHIVPICSYNFKYHLHNFDHCFLWSFIVILSLRKSEIRHSSYNCFNAVWRQKVIIYCLSSKQKSLNILQIIHQWLNDSSMEGK